ncbi:4'-phosphopantetheinyl transferase [Saccharothrix longispora]|uniref:4'-phosphopantetheinyl transferase family protein n=1 Tax=Saccharothrix longispora TaxID=33920 RepID=UPI0028FD7977|nr:4'-phosphopantetheinyl transferase superfamily protein [Saccharothrix longispora]MBY8850537.1 4'-phosphopantetheinyl transferase superfamily protein [Saccharothrix sp. MB29]MDU0292948.1 4'-phosphopantetheinyl transferase superfamily protein [Saccharothrix longispora]
MITDLLPPPISAVDCFGDPDGVVLFPEEEEHVAKAVDKRRKEFATGRHCARTALAGLGHAPAPLLPGPNREPTWPAGVVGSITHCRGYRAAAVGRVGEVWTIGIDAEPNEPTPDGVLEAIAVPGELARMPALRAAGDKVAWDRLLFSAKETVYKAWFPLTRAWLGFEDAEVTINPDDGTFSARVLIDHPVVDGTTLDGFTGRWLAREGFVVTAIAVPAR